MTKLEKLVVDRGVKVKWAHGAPGPVPSGMEKMHPYTVHLALGSRKITTPFFTGSAVTLEDRAPSKIAADVLYNLISDTESYENARNFEDWASDFGYDVDSRKAERIYQTLQKIARRSGACSGSISTSSQKLRATTDAE